MVRVSDGEIGTTTDGCSEVTDVCCCCCSTSVTTCSCSCCVSSSTALVTNKQRFLFLIESAFMRGWHGKVKNWREWEEVEDEEGIVEEERRIEWRDEDESSVAIFYWENVAIGLVW